MFSRFLSAYIAAIGFVVSLVAGAVLTEMGFGGYAFVAAALVGAFASALVALVLDRGEDSTLAAEVEELRQDVRQLTELLTARGGADGGSWPASEAGEPAAPAEQAGDADDEGAGGGVGAGPAGGS